MSDKYSTTFLLPEKNLASGIGSIANIFGNYYTYNSSETGEEADTKALENDWGMIGNDILNATDIVSKDLVAHGKDN